MAAQPLLTLSPVGAAEGDFTQLAVAIVGKSVSDENVQVAGVQGARAGAP